jgi:DNA polymerase I-like protein with 3'-5' exonuclease and polymerase domains
MKILLVCSEECESYLERFQKLEALSGHKVLKTTAKYDNPVLLDRMCDKHKIDAIVCSQQETMEAVLAAQPDFLPPNSRKQLTLDDYAGSLLGLRSGREFLVTGPLKRLRTVSHEKFVVSRYLTKLTAQGSWWRQTEFRWKEVTPENADEVMQRLAAARLLAVDIEVPWPQTDIRPISLCSYTGWYPESGTTETFVIEFLEPWHQEWMRRANDLAPPKVLQNGLFDSAYFLRWGMPLRNWYHDTFHLFHCWLSELPKRLDFITAFAVRKVRYWKDDGATDPKRYNAQDGWATMNALLALLQEIPEYAFRNYTEHEFPMVFPSLHAACEGILCDEVKFRKIAEEKQTEVERLLERLRRLVASPLYNPGSAKQNAKLFQLFGCGDLIKDPALGERENARRGTGKIQMQKAMARHPLNAAILGEVEAYKKAAKQVSTYFAPEKLWNGHILYSLNPGATDTGRAASSESAFDCGWQIQNIPNSDDSFKSCCVAPQGWHFGEADKAQSEARCVGYLSGEEALINLVESPHDYHSWNAAAFFGVPYESIYDESKKKTLNKQLRDLSKRTNHGANYNMGEAVMLDTMGPKKAAEAKRLLKLPTYMRLLDVCKHLLDQYNRTYPAVKGRWYASIVMAIERTGLLVSPLGWTRRFFGDVRGNKQDLNAAVAHAPQNLSVAVVNREWYRIWRETVYGSLRGRVRLKAQIHDSILFIYRDRKDAEAVLALMDTEVLVTGSDGVQRTMFVPSDLSANGGTSWADCKG